MTDKARTRDQVSPQDKWNVAALYASDALWEQDFAQMATLTAKVAEYQGRLGESAETLAEALDFWFGANRQIERVYVYAHLRNDEDLGNSGYQGMLDRARSQYVQFSAASSYLAPEIVAIDAETMTKWLETDRLKTYTFFLQDVMRGKLHTLSQPEERLMAMAAEPLSALSSVFGVLKNVELAARLPLVKGEEGLEEKLTHSSFITLQESHNRELRKGAFDAYYREWEGNRRTIAATLDGATKTHIFRAKARHYDSALAASLFDDNVDVAVYEALITAVHEALPAFYRYVDLRRRLLGYDRLHLYDAYVSVVPQVDLKYTWDEAVEIVCAALAPLGEDYVAVMRQGLDGGWVDRYENVGKRSGAYSSGCYDSMPYVLMNFTGTLDSVFTLAHELGHSMHSWLSNHHQPYHLADYRILIAEVASTTNEALLNHYLMSVTDDPAARAYLIDRQLDAFRGTLFRQTMFAEFEKLLHETVEQGQPVTAEGLDEMYLGLVKHYFGETMAFDEEDQAIAYEWARIDHFFYNFYVYKYATGMSAAIAIAQAIISEGDAMRDRYLDFLKGGGSDYPLALLRRAGVDLATPEPVASALQTFERLVGELEALLG